MGNSGGNFGSNSNFPSFGCSSGNCGGGMKKFKPNGSWCSGTGCNNMGSNVQRIPMGGSSFPTVQKQQPSGAWCSGTACKGQPASVKRIPMNIGGIKINNSPIYSKPVYNKPKPVSGAWCSGTACKGQPASVKRIPMNNGNNGNSYPVNNSPVSSPKYTSWCSGTACKGQPASVKRIPMGFGNAGNCGGNMNPNSNKPLKMAWCSGTACKGQPISVKRVPMGRTANCSNPNGKCKIMPKQTWSRSSSWDADGNKITTICRNGKCTTTKEKGKKKPKTPCMGGNCGSPCQMGNCGGSNPVPATNAPNTGGNSGLPDGSAGIITTTESPATTVSEATSSLVATTTTPAPTTTQAPTTTTLSREQKRLSFCAKRVAKLRKKNMIPANKANLPDCVIVRLNQIARKNGCFKPSCWDNKPTFNGFIKTENAGNSGNSGQNAGNACNGNNCGNSCIGIECELPPTESPDIYG